MHTPILKTCRKTVSKHCPICFLGLLPLLFYIHPLNQIGKKLIFHLSTFSAQTDYRAVKIEFSLFSTALTTKRSVKQNQRIKEFQLEVH